MKIVSQALTGVLAVGLVSVLGIVASPVVHAATVTVPVDCSSDVEFSVDIGDTIVFEFADNDDCDINTPQVDSSGIYNISVPGNDSEPGFLSTVMTPIYPDPADVSDTWYVFTHEAGNRIETTLNASTTRTGGIVNLAPGDIVAAIILDDSLGDFAITWIGSPVSIGTTRDLAIQQLAYGRQVTEVCREGYGASWALWPHAGTGGWVCVRNIYAYLPDLMVP